ncbi:hypothetical protein B0H10DRAFT_2230117 [Mycena sp. CBHHK59/15]|nr:hypothetical protein B0H10DRAFT_2230117 [Mycena sp. CBHHK59/15]
MAQWIHDGMSIERSSLTIALLLNHREHPLEDTWASITKLRDTLNVDLKKFRERHREIFPCLKLSALDVDEPELTSIQLPSYCMKHGQRPTPTPTIPADANDQDSQAREAEIKLRCAEADSGILAVRAASLSLSARNLQKAELMKTFEITMYNNAWTALIHLGHMEKDADEPYRPLSHRDTRRKETHLHRAKGTHGHSMGRRGAVALSREREQHSDDDEPQLLAGTRTLKRSGGFKHNQHSPKRLKYIAPDDVDVESAPSSDAEDNDLEKLPSKPGRQKGQRRGKRRGSRSRRTMGNEKLAAYKAESDCVQWFRTEAEMYRWLEAYERKHAELWRVIQRYRRDSEVWTGQADREEEQNGGPNGKVNFARMQAAMHRRLEHNAKVIFKSAGSGAHHDWVSATSFDELVTKIDGWRNVVFKWMDDMGIRRAYKDFYTD